ncbi:unnamed protein product [Camellia sinensis]
MNPSLSLVTSFLYNGQSKVNYKRSSILQSFCRQAVASMGSGFYNLLVPLIGAIPWKGRSLIIRKEITSLIPTEKIVLLYLHKLWLIRLLCIQQNRFRVREWVAIHTRITELQHRRRRRRGGARRHHELVVVVVMVAVQERTTVSGGDCGSVGAIVVVFVEYGAGIAVGRPVFQVGEDSRRRCRRYSAAIGVEGLVVEVVGCGGMVRSCNRWWWWWFSSGVLEEFVVFSSSFNFDFSSRICNYGLPVFRIPRPFKQSTRVLKGSELQTQLSLVQEDLKKAQEKLVLVEKEKTRANEELKEAQRLAKEANEKLREALVAQKQAEENSEIEKFWVVEMEQAGIEASQKKEEWQKEIEAVRNQHERLAERVKELLIAVDGYQRG